MKERETLTPLQNLQRRLLQAQSSKSRMCFCSSGCEAGPYADNSYWKPIECDCFCHIPMWKARLAKLGDV